MKNNSKDDNLKQRFFIESIKFEKLIMDNLSSYCYIINVDTNEIVYVNDRLADVFGVELYDISISKCHHFFYNCKEKCEACNAYNMPENEPFVWEYNCEKLNKTFRVKSIFITLDNTKYKLSFAEETSAKYTLLENNDNFQDALIKCTSIISEDTDVETTISETLAVIRDFYKSDRVCIFHFDDSKQYVSCTYVLDFDGFIKMKNELQKIPLTLLPHWLTMFENEGCVSIDSVAEMIDQASAKFKILEVYGVQNLLAVPIKHSGEMSGFVLVANATANIGNRKFLDVTKLFVKSSLDKQYVYQHLETLLNQDRLTGLYNRHYFEQTINEIKNKHINNIGIIYIDVNGLKKMNDNFGHSFGDCYIENCAHLMKEHFPNQSYRVGGDEFVVIVKDIDKETFIKKAEAFDTAIKNSKKISMSIGTAWCENYVNLESHLKMADTLMYQNKNIYYNSNGYFEEHFARNVIDMLQKNAEEQNLKVLYQPKIDLDTMKFIGAEAFLYKIDEFGNYIESQVFIPEYESLGNIYLLDLYLIEKCCTLIKNVEEEHNISIFTSTRFAKQTILVDNIHIECREICEKFNVDTSKITIEVSENYGFVESAEIFEKLQLFRKEGFKLSIENFGELHNKKEIIENNFDKVKLSKNLLTAADIDVTKYTILDHLIQNYKTIPNIDIIINGISDEEHLKFLEAYNDLTGQGSLLSSPLTKEDFFKYLKKIEF